MNKTRTIPISGQKTTNKEKKVALIRVGINVDRTNLSQGGRRPHIPVVCNALNASTLFTNGQTVPTDGTAGHIS
ncbi:hypothetical protein FCL47_03745 [Desulfopila sp. IMCC35006]|uniref:hypothetical protein n=1 Tax=Desulfopila sp. IMCC35006 TaxID=2569542 RepID=UPI0010AC6FE4|nr:hypothetical protein [Desulfopila sp. IMCC35006]TKB28605.1 hypothetical protein FCL47_03745 [Desulfopila sp. IMCC35006]